MNPKNTHIRNYSANFPYKMLHHLCISTILYRQLLLFTEFLQERTTDILLCSSNLWGLDPRQSCFSAFNLTTLETKSHPDHKIYPQLRVLCYKTYTRAQNWLRSAESSSTWSQCIGISESTATTKQEQSTKLEQKQLTSPSLTTNKIWTRMCY